MSSRVFLHVLKHVWWGSSKSVNAVRTHTSQKSSDGLNISTSKDVRQRIDHREAQGVDTDPPLSCKRKHVFI